MAVDSSLGRFRRQVSVWLGIVALAFNIFAGAALPAQTAQAAAPQAAESEFGQAFMVCTGAGMVAFGEDGKPVPSQNSPSHDHLCIFCLPLVHGGISLPAVQPLIEPFFTVLGSVEVLPMENPAAPPRWRGISSPRAPPLA